MSSTPPPAEKVEDVPAAENAPAAEAAEVADKGADAPIEESSTKEDEPFKKTEDVPAEEPVKEDKSEESAAAAEEKSEEKAEEPATEKKEDDKPAPAQEKATPAKRTPAKKQKSDANDSAHEGNYQPGDVVMAKIKGFPWWPAMVVTEAHCIPSVLKDKPRGSKTVFPTIFFPVTNKEYCWPNKSELKPLPNSEIDSFVDNTGKKPKDILAAYKSARNPPSLEELEEIIKKASVAATAPVEDEDEGMEDAEEAGEDYEEEEEGEVKKKTKAKATPKKKAPAKKGEATKNKRKSESEVEDSADEDEKKVAKTPAKKAKTSNGSAKKTASSRKASAASKAAAADGDDNEEEVPPTPTTQPSAQSIADKLQKDVLYLRHKLQKAMLSNGQEPNDSDMDDVKGWLGKLEAIGKNMTSAVFSHTKVHKVLRRITKLSAVPRDEDLKIRDVCQNLLDQWKDIIPGDSDKKEESAPANESQDKKEEKTEQSAEPSEGAEKKEESAKEAAESGDVDMKDAPAAPAEEETKMDVVMPAEEEAGSTETKEGETAQA
ncbi:hypothetical protein SAICODRAFT_9404 [Saitoella complicata NRRL Y-17804]|nr:uncharacterized protein SAICODRAFT_9404 [Saitoella complicata NRRL Y-17804]ODQ51081.1 hypothetical protein SAICODRAFT_9404 [Saitoella complicata NRRL Y-17804]